MNWLAQRRALPAIPLLVFGLLSLFVVTLGIHSYEHERTCLQRDVRDQLTAIAELKARQIEAWRRERLVDAEVLARNPLVVPRLSACLLDADEPPAYEVTAWLSSLQRVHDFAEVALLDSSGRRRWSSAPRGGQLDPNRSSLLSAARTSGKPVMSDLHRDLATGRTLAEVVAPVGPPTVATEGVLCIGALLLEIDPGRFLLPLIQSWPTPSASAETLLLRRDRDQIVFLAEPRHGRGPGAAMSMQMPLAEQEFLAPGLVDGESCVVAGPDYRGKLVWAALRPVAGTRWVLVSKVDQDEILARLRARLLGTLVSVCGLLVLAGLGLAFWWQRAESRLVERQAEAESARQMMAKRFDFYARYANDLIWLADPDGRILAANDRALVSYGYEREQILCLNLRDLVVPSQWPRMAEHMHQALASGGLVFESEHRRRDGSAFAVEVSVRVFDAEGRRFFQGILRDITERKRAEEHIRRIERALRTRTECSQCMVRAASEPELVERVCLALIAIGGYRLAWFGYTEPAGGQVLRPVAVAGLDDGFVEAVLASVRGEDCARDPVYVAVRGEGPVVRHDLSASEGGPAWQTEARKRGITALVALPVVCGSQTVGVLSVCASQPRAFGEDELRLLGELAGDLAYGIAALRTRREHESLLRSLRQSEARYRALVETQEDAVCRWRPDTTLTYVNEGYCRLFGRSREELLNCKWLEVLSTPLRQQFEGIFDSLVAEPRRDLRALHTTDEEGRATWQEWVHTPVLDEAGRLVEFQSVGRDITERKVLEVKLLQSQKLETVGRLAGGVAHDFNNLLTVINGHMEMVLEQVAADHPLYEELDEIRKAGEKAVALTRQLLMFSRQQAAEPDVFDLNALVTDMQKMLRRLIGEDIRLTTTLASEPARILADRTHVEQVILNLAVNARDAMPEGGQLSVETAVLTLGAAELGDPPDVAPGPFVTLAITDTGVGMGPEVLARLSEPFFTTKEKGRGTGLGLSTVYGIVRDLGGCVRVSSQPGHGTCFRVYVPQTEKQPRAAPSRDLARTAPATGTETVLLVEDDRALRLLASVYLKSAGYTVIPAGNGVEALAICEGPTGPIQIMIADIVMPGMNGPELCRRVAALRPQMRVLCMSGFSSGAWARRQIGEMGLPFLQKPFTRASLLNRTRAVLDGTAAASRA